MPRKEPANSSLKIEMLGTFRLAVGGVSVEATRWARRKSKMLLKLLALQPQHQLHREQIIELLWPDQGGNAAVNNLYKTVHAARRALEPELVSGNDSHFVLTQDQQIMLRAPHELWVDTEVFQRLASDALKRADVRACEAALSLYQGDLLTEDPYEDWISAHREQLRQTYDGLLSKFSKLYKELGQYERSVSLLKELIARDVSNEQAYRQLMLLYALQGKRHEALRLYEQCRSVLRREIGTEPDKTTIGVYEQIIAGNVRLLPQDNLEKPDGERPAGQRQGPARPNLPLQLTSFVGREQEIARVKQLLRDNRLLTLTGTGGIGKTRLGLQVAAEVLAQYPGGVWLVELAPLTDPELLPRTIATTLGVRQEPGRTLLSTLDEYLRVRRVLLVFDNCEHLLETVATVAEHLLSWSPELHILTTSRQALDLAGEAVWQVSALSLPSSARPADDTNLLEYEAVRLFIDRVSSSNPRWALTEQNRPAVARLCRCLDGIPLALELAAARVKMLTVEEIVSKLDDRFDLLFSGCRSVMPRHQTLRAAIDWSYSLLRPKERTLLHRVSVFAGGWTLAAAESICAGEGIEKCAVLTLLSHLIDKSLVIVEPQGAESRYRLLETIRQYAAQKVSESEEVARIYARHLDWFLQLAEQSDLAFSRPEQGFWFMRLEVERDNLGVALQWSLQAARDPDKGLRLCVALWRFWQAHGYVSEGRRWFDLAFSLPDASSKSFQAKAFHGASALACMQGDFEHARVYIDQSLTLQRETKNRCGIAHELHRLGIIAYYVGDYQQAIRLQEETLALCYELGDQCGIARAINGLGIIALDQGDYDQAASKFEECLAVYRQLGHTLGVMGTLNNLGETARRQSDIDRAETLLQESLKLAKELGDKGWVARAMHILGNIAMDRGDYRLANQMFKKALVILREIEDVIVMYVLEGLACMSAAQGEPARALRLAEAASVQREATRLIRSPADQCALDRCLRESRRIMSFEETERAIAEGRAMTIEQAITYALHSN
jgi:predicted ATPase/DNA-binding SARP family transcriptional activator